MTSESVNFHEIAFNSASEGLVVVDDKAKIVVVNKRLCEMFKFKESDLIGKKIEMLIPMERRDAHKGMRDGYIKSPKARPMGMTGARLEGQRNGGQVFPVEVSLNHFDKDNQKFILGIVTDVTERDRIERELKEAQHNLHKLNEELETLVVKRTFELNKSKKLYESIASNFPDGIISVIDRNLSCIFMDGLEIQSLGYDTSEWVGKPFLERFNEDYTRAFRAAIEECFLNGNNTFEYKNDERHYQVNMVGIYGEDKQIDRLLIVESNISKQKEIELEQIKALEKERELGNMKSRFVSMASHEFRTPLGAILSSASLIEKYPESEQQDKRLKHTSRIKSSVKNLTDILNDFLSFEKLNSDMVKPDVKTFDVCELVDYATEELGALKKEGQQLEVVNLIGSCELNSDPKIVLNILLNLVSNGLKYSGENGRVKIELDGIKDGIMISVEDNGIGISKEDQKNLFERFFRADNVSNIQGTGLGLNIVKKYLEILGGNISFTSTEGVGSKFRVEIPMIK